MDFFIWLDLATLLIHLPNASNDNRTCVRMSLKNLFHIQPQNECASSSRVDRFHQHFLPTFSGEQDEKLFWRPEFWFVEGRIDFGKFRHSFRLIQSNIMLVKLNNIFFPNAVGPHLFTWQKKVLLNRPKVVLPLIVIFYLGETVD